MRLGSCPRGCDKSVPPRYCQDALAPARTSLVLSGRRGRERGKGKERERKREDREREEEEEEEKE